MFVSEQNAFSRNVLEHQVTIVKPLIPRKSGNSRDMNWLSPQISFSDALNSLSSVAPCLIKKVWSSKDLFTGLKSVSELYSTSKK